MKKYTNNDILVWYSIYKNICEIFFIFLNFKQISIKKS